MRADHSIGLLRSTEIPGFICCQNKKQPWEGNHYFWKNKNKKISQSIQKTSLSYLECDQNGFPIKTWEDPPVSYYNDSRLCTILSLRQSKMKVMSWEREKKVSLNKNSLMKKKIGHSCFLFTITLPPPLQFYFNIMLHILFCFQVTFQEKVIFFLSNISQFLVTAQHLNNEPLPTRSQFSSLWLWFTDERNPQLCWQGTNI